MQSKFTAQAKAAFEYAQTIVDQFRHSYLGTEHLLVGLLHVKDSVAQTVGLECGITDEDVVEKMREVLGFGDKSSVITRDYTPRLKRVIELSSVVASQMNVSTIGTEQLLLAIVRERNSVAVKLLEVLNVNVTTIISSIMEIVSVDGSIKNTQFGGNQGKVQVKSNTPTLDKYSRDLTALAKEEKFDPIIGREKEIERITQILSRRTKNNPCLVGEPGVGKTAVVEGLAQKIIAGAVPDLLQSKRVVSLDLSAMISGTKYRGEFEERIHKVLEEVQQAGETILFIDELHTIIGAGGAEGAMDAANILKPSLARGEIQIVGATTLEYRKHIEKDAALERRFQPVTVDEPTELETVTILEGIKDKYEVHHQVQITEEALKAAVRLSSRYIVDRFLP
ncbi:MAG: ATP-dependent Clp protease ATP-binding subunit, partial [Niameybacter sp.]